MACQCGCATDVSSPDSDTRPVGEGEGEGKERDLKRVVEELESRVKQLEIERASA